MSNINRDYLIKVDVKTSKVEAPAMHFYNTDIGTSNIYVQLTIKKTLINVSPIENATDYRIQASIIKPNNVLKVLNGELVNEEEAIFEFDLPDDCTNISGTYQLEFNINCIVSKRTEKITTFPASYEVKKSILTDFVPEITDTEDNTMMEDILTQLEGKFDDVRVNVEETGSTQVSLDFYSNDVKIKNLKFTSGAFIDDTTTAKNKTWSSSKIDSQIKDIENTKVNLQKVKELIADAQLEGTEIDTSTFVRKSQLDNISLISGNMANVEAFLVDKKILAWDDGQNRNTCVDSVAQPGWIVFNEVECMQGDTLFLLNNTEKLLGICNIFSQDGTLSRVANVSEVTGITINENEKYIRMCYNNDSNKDLNLFQIKKDTSDLNKFESFGNIPILSEEEKDNINTKLKDLDAELLRLFNIGIKINTTIGLYNTLTKEEQFTDNEVYVKAKIPVNGGEVLYINATNLNDYNFKAYIILDGNGNIIASCEGYGNDELVKDLKVEIPVNGRMILLNSTAENGIQVKKNTKTRIDDIENQVNTNKTKIDDIENEVATNKTKIDDIENKINEVNVNTFNYENDIKRFTRTQLKNPFKYKTFDKPYITFCFDDGTNDLDKIASIFKEFDYPMCMALPHDSLNTICVGLQSESNGYTVNMKVKDVAMKVIENGGEVLCHSWTPITLDNINDKELLTETFISNVKVLRNAGFEVNGIITAGGAGALDGGLEQGGDVFQYWATIEFDYSDRYGFTEDYFYPRMNLGDSLEMNKTRIDDAINHNKWVVFFGHALQDSGNYTEQNLRAILQYCKDNNVSVVPYKYIYNTFK